MNRSPLTAQSPTSLLPKQSQAYSYGVPRRITRSEKAPVVSTHASFTPINYESGYAYPLIVWLHGPESSESEVLQVMPLVSARNYVAIAPRGTCHSQRVRCGYGWGESQSDIVDAAERVENCIQYARQQFHVHPDRIFLAGHASGGTLALRLGMEYPELVAGAISLGGPAPRGHRPLKRINAARKLPLMLAVSPDESYPLEGVMDDLRMLHCAGFSLALRLYPEGDELTTAMLADVNRWIMESFCPTVVSARC
jgi:phospholipase/carboxylesterase